MLAVLGYGSGAGSWVSPVATAKVTTIGHVEATAHLVARPSLPDQNASLVPALVLMVMAGFVLVSLRRVVPQLAGRGRRPSGRAPPGPVTHR